MYAWKRVNGASSIDQSEPPPESSPEDTDASDVIRPPLTGHIVAPPRRDRRRLLSLRHVGRPRAQPRWSPTNSAQRGCVVLLVELLRIDRLVSGRDLEMQVRTTGLSPAADFGDRVPRVDGVAGVDEVRVVVSIGGDSAVVVSDTDPQTETRCRTGVDHRTRTSRLDGCSLRSREIHPLVWLPVASSERRAALCLHRRQPRPSGRRATATIRLRHGGDQITRVALMRRIRL